MLIRFKKQYHRHRIGDEAEIRGGVADALCRRGVAERVKAAVVPAPKTAKPPMVPVFATEADIEADLEADVDPSPKPKRKRVKAENKRVTEPDVSDS